MYVVVWADDGEYYTNTDPQRWGYWSKKSIYTALFKSEYDAREEITRVCERWIINNSVKFEFMHPLNLGQNNLGRKE